MWNKLKEMFYKVFLPRHKPEKASAEKGSKKNDGVC